MTKKQMVLNALDGFYMNHEGNINESYLNHYIKVIIENTKDLYMNVRQKRSPVKSIVWKAFTLVAQEALEQDACIKVDYTYVRSNTLKFWLQTRTKNVEERGLYASLKESIDYVTQERVNYFAGRE